MNSVTNAKQDFISEMNELEARQRELQKELEQIQAKLETLHEVEKLVDSATSKLQEVARKIIAEAPERLEDFHNAILTALKVQEESHRRKQIDLFDITTSAVDPEQLTPPLQCDLPVPSSSTPEKGDIVQMLAEGFILSTPHSTPKSAPAELEQNEPSETAKSEKRSRAEQPFAEFISLSSRVGYQRRISNGQILCAYLGGKNKSLLEVWGRCIRSEAGDRCKYELREAKRLKDVKYELKIIGISFATLEGLTHIDTSKSPKFRAVDKGEEDERHETDLAADSHPNDARGIFDEEHNAVKLKVGDRVLIKTDRQGSEFIGQVGTVSAPSKVGAAVNVAGQLKYFLAEELNMVQQATESRNPADDLAVSRPIPLELTAEPVPW